MSIPRVPFILFKPILLVADMLLYPCSAGADMLAVSAGGGNLTTHRSHAVFVHYLKNAPDLFNRESLYDFTVGHWSGPSANSAITAARVVRWRLSPPSYYFAAMLGIGLVDRRTDHLGTNGQFIVRLAFGHKFGEYDLSIGESHYSNGKYALNLPWEGPNTGENFTTLMLAREF